MKQQPAAWHGPDWTLFLDRDGVLNRTAPGTYITRIADFQWLPGTVDTLARLRPMFGRVVVATNQQGIAKGLMREADLADLHRTMLAQLEAAGVRLDAVYYCPHRADAGCACRKPKPGMALAAQQQFPEIDFRRAWMIGDSESDIEFGRNLGMRTIRISGDAAAGSAADLQARDLSHAAALLAGLAAGT
ncbi:MAG: HAD family hydrolase [Bacteroidia bacterium]|nr:HAD family hydrolase [Bacteroidia bacterium]